jgi:purine-binding chemotaxis protein CheW
MTQSAQQVQPGVEQYLTFSLGNEEYGVSILKVQGIQGWDKVTTIPNTPAHILGVINLRGSIVPIIDLRKRFGLAVSEFGTTTVVIVVKVAHAAQERIVGLVVDAVSEVCNVGADDYKAAPDFGPAVDTNFVHGLVTVNDRMVILLDIEKLITEGLISTTAAH